MKELFTTAPVLAWSIVSVLVALGFVALQWEKVKWWWHNTWYSFPVIGKIAGLSKDINPDPSSPTWFQAEKTLCRDYKKFIRIQDEHDYNQKILYMTKAGDTGRKDTPALIWLLTVALVFVEAMGFSYVLAGYTLPGASENLQQTGAYGIAFLLSVILVGFTHFAGHELFRSGQIQGARRDWAEAGRKEKLYTGERPLAQNQAIDDDQPHYTQLINRVGRNPSYKLTALTCIVVGIVAIFATYVRGQVLEKQLLQEVAGSQPQAELNAGGSDSLNMNAAALPDALKAEDRAVDKKVVKESIDIDRHGGWGTFIVLAFIFVFLQILGTVFGYKWGFAGKDSKAAFHATGAGRYASYADVREHYKVIADTAQSKLGHLQQQLMDRNAEVGSTGVHTSRTFYDYMAEARKLETIDQSDQENHTKLRKQHVATVASAPPVAETPSQPGIAASADPVAHALKQVEALNDADAKKSYVASLPGQVRDAVVSEIRAQKERAAAAKAAELDELFE